MLQNIFSLSNDIDYMMRNQKAQLVSRNNGFLGRHHCTLIGKHIHATDDPVAY